LKRVDQLIKAKDLQRALLETASAKMIDPQNAYAFALEERIRGLIAEQSKTQRQKEQIKSQPELVINAGREGDKKSLPQVSVVLPQNINQIALSVTSTVPHVQQSNIPTAGRISNKFQQRAPFSLIADSSGKGNDNEIRLPPKVVVIDDDKDLLAALSLSIESDGFEVMPLSTSDEAYVLLQKFTPDIILCDISLETSTMGGFTFFEKVQEIEHLKQVPFIFLSGLNDDVMIRTGKEMGADDYLVKPIKEQNLLAALRGKLKRFQQLREIPKANIHNFPVASSLCEIHS
ncbi:MAG: response regulator, partial [Bacteroidota bacterium]